MVERVMLHGVSTTVQNKVYELIGSMERDRLIMPVGAPNSEWRFLGDRRFPVNFMNSLDAGLATNADGKSAQESANAVHRFLSEVARQEGIEDALKTVIRFAESAATDAVINGLRQSGYHRYPISQRVIINASYDAGMFAGMTLIEDIGYDNTRVHLMHAASRWGIWKSGFGLAIEVKGIFFVAGDTKPSTSVHADTSEGLLEGIGSRS